MNLSIRHMKAFAALAATRNFTRAAEQCNLTQSAFSALIANLESGLGVKLFSRNTRNVELTAEGEVFHRTVQHLLPETERAIAELRDHVERRKGRIAMAALPSIFSGILPRIIAQFVKEHPGIALVIEDVSNKVCVDLVRDRRVDFALCAFAPAGADLAIETLASDSFYFVCRSDHPLAQRTRISAGRLEREPIIVFEKASSIRQHLDASIYPRQWAHSLEVNNLSTAAGLIAAGLGATVVPALALAQFQGKGLRVIPVELPIHRREICLVRRKDATESVAVRAFLELLRTQIDEEMERFVPHSTLLA